MNSLKKKASFGAPAQMLGQALGMTLFKIILAAEIIF